MISENLKNLFIVKTPLQVINTIEAIEYFKLKNNILVMISDSSNQNGKQMNYVMSLCKWDKVIKIEAKASFLTYTTIIKSLQGYKYNYMFFARFGSIQRLIISNTSKNKLYYFDDGTETITMYNNLLLTNKINKFTTRHFSRIRYLFAGLKININEPINLFTYFNLKPFGKSEVVINKLDNFKTKYLNKSENDNNTYILGQPLFEKGLVNEDIYISYVNSIVNKSENNVIYIPHKGESKNSRVRNILNDNFKILELNMPIELYFLENNIQPLHVISFFTTAFFTLNLLYSKTLLEYIKIPEKLLLKKKGDILKHYEFIDSIGIKKITCK